MISLTTKIIVSRIVMIISWAGVVTPNTTPNEIRTDAVAKSADIRVLTLTSMYGQLLLQYSEPKEIVVSLPSSSSWMLRMSLSHYKNCCAEWITGSNSYMRFFYHSGSKNPVAYSAEWPITVATKILRRFKESIMKEKGWVKNLL